MVINYNVRKPNHKPWIPLLDTFHLVHTFKYQKDRHGEEIILFHMNHIDTDHDVGKIDNDFRNFIREIGFTYIGIKKSPLGYEGYGEKRKELRGR